ncbi:hypothetical protein ACJJI5_10555 [Microbulbifer sp. EKSA008]|uniref:hypothetical protein n=1 Tax=unclassified Microbulbifer TaxID=2619833 RepID=UPI00403A2EE7
MKEIGSLYKNYLMDARMEVDTARYWDIKGHAYLMESNGVPRSEVPDRLRAYIYSVAQLHKEVKVKQILFSKCSQQGMHAYFEIEPVSRGPYVSVRLNNRKRIMNLSFEESVPSGN